MNTNFPDYLDHPNLLMGYFVEIVVKSKNKAQCHYHFKHACMIFQKKLAVNFTLKLYHLKLWLLVIYIQQ